MLLGHLTVCLVLLCEEPNVRWLTQSFAHNLSSTELQRDFAEVLSLFALGGAVAHLRVLTAFLSCSLATLGQLSSGPGHGGGRLTGVQHWSVTGSWWQWDLPGGPCRDVSITQTPQLTRDEPCMHAGGRQASAQAADDERSGALLLSRASTRICVALSWPVAYRLAHVWIQ